MTAMLRIMCQVIARRLASGEELEQVFTDYPHLAANEIEQIRNYARGAAAAFDTEKN